MIPPALSIFFFYQSFSFINLFPWSTFDVWICKWKKLRNTGYFIWSVFRNHWYGLFQPHDNRQHSFPVPDIAWQAYLAALQHSDSNESRTLTVHTEICCTNRKMKHDAPLYRYVSCIFRTFPIPEHSHPPRCSPGKYPALFSDSLCSIHRRLWLS